MLDSDPALRVSRDHRRRRETHPTPSYATPPMRLVTGRQQDRQSLRMAGTQVRTRRDYADNVCEKAREITAPGRKRGIIPLSACRMLCRYRHGIRLLLFTGCRRGEILHLKWKDVGDEVLDLSDSKTGPRRVYLNSAARNIIENQPRTDSPFVFASPGDLSRPLSRSMPLWYFVRERAGIGDVRLHDLRHNLASHAVMQGVPLPTVAKLLGHRQVSMTLRYAHVHDTEVEAAAERIGRIITNIWEPPGS